MATYFLKELRQLRREVTFFGALGLQLVLSILLLFGHSVNAAGIRSDAAALLCAIIGFAAAVVIATALAARWGSELDDDALNPMVTTPLAPTAVVAGKFLATFLAVVVPPAIAQIFIVCALPPEDFGMFFGHLLPACMTMLLTATGLILAAATGKRRNASIATGVLALLLIMPMVLSFWGKQEIPYADTVFIILRVLLPLPLIFTITVAAVSPAGSDRVIPVRIVMLLTLAAYAVTNAFASPDSFGKALTWEIRDILFAGALCSAAAAALERRAQSRRVAAAIRRTGPVLRPLRILCSSGAVTELLLSLILFAAAVTIAFAKNRAYRVGDTMLYFYTVLLFYTALTLFVTGMVKRIKRREIAPGVVFVIVMGLGMLAGMIFPLPLVPDAFMEDMNNAWNVMFLVLVPLSILLLIPTVVEFAKSLKRP